MWEVCPSWSLEDALALDIPLNFREGVSSSQCHYSAYYEHQCPESEEDLPCNVHTPPSALSHITKTLKNVLSSENRETGQGTVSLHDRVHVHGGYGESSVQHHFSSDWEASRYDDFVIGVTNRVGGVGLAIGHP